MKQTQITVKTDLSIQKAQAAKDLSTVIPNPDKFYVVTDSSVKVPTHYSEQPTLQTFIDNELGVTIVPSLNDYIHILTTKIQLSGTVSVGAGLKAVAGVGTAFTSELSPNEKISIISQEIEVESITDDENLILKTHHKYGAVDSIAYKVVEQWWRYTSGDGSQPEDYTQVDYDPENNPGISSNGLYWPDPENLISDYTANFIDDPATGNPFEGVLGGDDYFQSAADPKSMFIKIVKTAGEWVLGIQANIILIVDTDGDLFAIIHSTGTDFTSDAEWSLVPEYNFSWASVLEGMIVDSVKRTVEADSVVIQIENSYQTVRQIARKMGKNADLVVGTIVQNGLYEADHLIDNWIADLIAGSRTRVLFREATYVPTTDWNVTEKVHLDFDRDAKLDMTSRTHTFADLSGRLVVENAANNSIVITGDIKYLIVESDNDDCLNISGSKYTIIHNGKLVSDTTTGLDQKIDSAIQGLDPQESILSILDFTTAEPAAPSIGDRHINSVTGDSSQTTQAVTANYIYEWNGTDWTEIIPDNKTFLPNEATNGFLIWNGSAWVSFGSILQHNNLSGLDVGDYKHLTASDDTTVSQSEAEDKDDTTRRMWSPQRVHQAMTKYSISRNFVLNENMAKHALAKLRSDGKIETVATGTENEGVSGPVTFEPGAAHYKGICFDPATNRIFIAYRNQDALDHLYGVVGVVNPATDTITFPNSPRIVAANAVNGGISCCFDASTNKILVAWSDGGSSSITVNTIVIANDDFTASASVNFITNSDNVYVDCCYYASASKCLVAYQYVSGGAARVQIVDTSGATPTTGNVLDFESNNGIYTKIEYDSVQDRALIMWSDTDTSAHAITCNLTGTILTLGVEATFYSGDADYNALCFDSSSESEKFALFYKKTAVTSIMARVGTIVLGGSPAADTVTFGTEVLVTSNASYGDVLSISCAYNSDNQQIVIHYLRLSDSIPFYITGKISGTDFVPNTPQQVYNSVCDHPVIAYDSYNKRMVLALRDVSDSYIGKAFVVTLNLDSEDIAGILREVGSTDDSKEVIIPGGFLDGFTGKIPGNKLYVNLSTGALQDAKTNFEAGRFMSATELHYNPTKAV